MTDPIACSFGGASASVLLTPAATVAAQATDAGASAALEYHWEVVGGSVGDIVPVLVSAFLDTSAAGASQAQAGIVVWIGSNFQQVVACAGLFCLSRPPHFEDTLVVSARVGTVNKINLNASVALTSLTGSGFAIADPFIRVDPAFSLAANYSVVVSEGVANVPEPGTSALLGAALAAFGGWRRRPASR